MQLPPPPPFLAHEHWEEIDEEDGSLPDFLFGMAVALVGDVDRDGARDLAIAHEAAGNGSGHVWLVSARTGAAAFSATA